MKKTAYTLAATVFLLAALICLQVPGGLPF